MTMSAKDLARVGLLVAMRGVWNGKRLIGDTRLVAGHGGGNASLMQGWSDTMITWGQVTTSGVSPDGLRETVVGPVRKRTQRVGREK